jgi:CO/xanthine dehydrogenase Mo-binding subunit
MNKIRVIPSVVGGGFGGKNRTLIEPICVALARKANRPVKLTLTREEEFTSATSRHPCIIRMKTGVKKDGTLLVRVVKLIYDCGAYMMVPNAIWLGAVNACGPYRIPNFEVNSYAAYTNKNMSAAFRGFGAPQVSFAYESQMDMIAERLGVDPVEIRLKNGMETGDSLPTGQAAASVEVKRTLTSAAKKAGWPEKKNSLGLASASFVCGGFVSSSFVRLNEDGTAVVASGAMDMGQGLRTVMAQIAAEELGLAFEDIVVVNADTDATPFDIGVFGDRGTNTAGMAVKMAAAEVKQEIVARAAALLEANVQDLEVRDGKIFVCGAPARAIALLDVLKGSQYLKGGPILGKASLMPEVQFSPPEVAQGQVTPFFRTVTFNSQLAEVKVDEETGTVKLTRLISCHDCGQAINPMGVEGQIDGGLVIGAGYGLYEQVIIDQGQVLNPGFTEYRMLTAADMPPMQGEIMAGADPTGPFGAKGAGNATLIPTAPAIDNALYNAVGVRIKELPITPPKILDALEHCSKVKVHKAWAKLFV